MKQKLLNWSLFVLVLLLVLSACGSAPQPTEEPATAEEYVEYIVTPNFDELQAKYAYPENYCPGTWITSRELEFKGFYAEHVLLSEIKDSNIVTQVWLITLDNIRINDHIVDTKTWTVVQEIISPEENSYFVQELEPEQWVVRAQELAKKAPDMTLKMTYTWTNQTESGNYQWVTLGECSKK